MTETLSTGLSEDELLVQLLTLPPFPNMATVEVATRCGIRALTGFSALDPEERADGDAWPMSTADSDILFCLRVLATCASMIRFQDEQILRRILGGGFFARQAVNGALASHSMVVRACCDIAIVVAGLFDEASVSKASKDRFLSAIDKCNAADPIGNSAYVVETDDHSGSAGPEMTLLKEPLYSAWVDREEITDQDEINARISAFEGHETLNGLHRRGKAFEYWTSWYEGFFVGKPLDWELQRQVILIDDTIWDSGCYAVAEEIGRIRAKLDLEKRIKELEAELRRAVVNRHGIGGNMPPEQFDNAQIAQELLIVWQPLKDLKKQIAKDDLDPAGLQKIIEALLVALKKGILWCLKKGDLVVDTAIKWAIPAGGTGYLALNPEKLEAVIESAKKLLGVL